MQITGIKLHKIEIPLASEFYTMHSKKPFRKFQEYLVEITTHAGKIGFGSCWFKNFNPEWENFIETKVAPFILNKNIDQVLVKNFVNRFYYKQNQTQNIPLPSCLEIALWDLIGKKHKKPIYKLLGGKKNRIKPYASLLEPSSKMSIKKWIYLIEQTYKKGFRAAKLHIGTNKIDPYYIVDVVKNIRKKRDDIDLMIDVMQSWKTNCIGLQKAKILAQKLEKYNVKWLEEPLPYIDSSETSSILAKLVNIDIAGGGRLSNPIIFEEILKNNSLDIIQPDIQNTGGIYQTIKISEIAKKYNKKCIPHFYGTNIGFIATLHTCGVINSPYIEYPYHPPYITSGTIFALLDKPIILEKDGYVKIPEKPGLGINLDETWTDYIV